jgi:hypothetical protein
MYNECYFYPWKEQLWSFNLRNNIYLGLKQGRRSMVFCFDLSGWDLPTHGASCCVLYWCLWRDELWMSKGAPTWFETFWSYGVKAIDYWTIFSNNVFGKSKLKKIIGIWRCSWYLLKSSWGVRFNRVYITISRAKMREMLIFEWILFAGNLNKLQKLCLKGKIIWVLNVVHIVEFWKF